MALRSTDIPLLVICSVSILLGLLLLHNAWLYYRLVQTCTPELKGRYSRVVLCIIALGSAYFLIYQPFLAICEIASCGNNTYLIHNLLVQATATIYPFVIAYRSWMIYYKIKWNIAMEDTEWSKFIDTHSNRNWFLAHYEFNKRYTSRIFVVIWSMLEIPAFLVTLFGHSHFDLLSMIYGVQYFGPVLFLAFLLCKIPKYDDVFLIRDEMKLIVTACLLTAVLYVPAIMMPFLLPNVGHIMLRIYVLIGPFCILYAHLYFPFKTFHLPKTLCALHAQQNVLRLEVNQNSMTTPSTPTTERTTNAKLRMRDTLAFRDGFHAFARHMNKEFAIDNLLFLLEIYQFKHKMTEMFGKEELHTLHHGDVFSSVHFPQNLPISTLIRDTSKQNVYQSAAVLFVKYIAEDAYFAINIAYSLRIELYEAFVYDNKQDIAADVLANNLTQNVTDWNGIYHLFDDPVLAVYRMLKDSFSRFEQTESYLRLLCATTNT